MPKAVRPDSPGTEDLEQSVKEQAQRFNAKPWFDAKELQVTLKSGDITLQHGLKRKPQGWRFHSVASGKTATGVAILGLFAVTGFTDTAITINTQAISAGAFHTTVGDETAGTCILEIW